MNMNWSWLNNSRAFVVAGGIAMVSVLAAALLAGCGGGGGGTNNNVPATYSISGTVSGSVATGVTVTLSGASAATVTTTSSGNYSFTGLANGSYTVTPTLAGNSFSPTSLAVSVSDADVTGQNFTASTNTAPTYTLSGTVDALDGVTITSGGGAYSFSGLTGATSYTVTPSRTGYSFSPTSRTVAITTSNATVPNFAATAQPIIKGTAATGAAISGIVYAYDVNGAASPIANINADGTYIIDATGLTAPLMITTIGVSNLKPAIYHSLATSADINQNVNVTPLTELVLAFAAGQPAQDIPLANMPAVVTNIPAAVSEVVNIIAPLTAAVGATINNPLTDTFSANGTGMDQVLDNINVMPAIQGGTIDILLVGNNVSLGTVALPATAGQAATATANATVTATELTNAQKMTTAISEANACMAPLTALYATSIPAASAVQAYLDPNFKSFGFNASTFATYFTTAASTGNGRGDIGLKWGVGSVADYDFTPPALGAAATTALPAPVTYDVNGNITAMWVVAQVGGFIPKMKMIKGAPYTGCTSGWLIHGNDMDIGDVDIIPSYQKSTFSVGGSSVFGRGVNVRLGLGDIIPVEPTASTVIVTGPGFATSGSSGAAAVASPSVTLVMPGGAENTMLISGGNGITLPYCQDTNSAGILCFDETKVPAGALYTWSVRDNTNAMLREWIMQFPKAGLTWAQVQANAANIFPTITGHTATASWLTNLNATADAAAVPGYTINFTLGSFASGSPTGYLIAQPQGGGSDLQIFQNPASVSGTYAITGNKVGTYTNAGQVWGGIDSDFMGILVTTGTMF